MGLSKQQYISSQIHKQATVIQDFFDVGKCLRVEIIQALFLLSSSTEARSYINAFSFLKAKLQNIQASNMEITRNYFRQQEGIYVLVKSTLATIPIYTLERFFFFTSAIIFLIGEMEKIVHCFWWGKDSLGCMIKSVVQNENQRF